MACTYTAAQCTANAAALAEAQEALHALLIGGREIEITHANKTVRFSSANLDALRAYVGELQRIADACAGTRRHGNAFRFVPRG